VVPGVLVRYETGEMGERNASRSSPAVSALGTAWPSASAPSTRMLQRGTALRRGRRRSSRSAMRRISMPSHRWRRTGLSHAVRRSSGAIGARRSSGASSDHCHLFGKEGRAFERRIVEVLSVAW